MPKTSHAKKSSDLRELESKLSKMSTEEVRELLLINTYKLALTRAQLDAVVDVLIKKGITSYDDVWKKTNEIFEETKRE